MVESNWAMYTSYNTAQTNQSTTFVPIILYLFFIETIFFILEAYCFSFIYFVLAIVTLVIFLRKVDKINKFYLPYFKSEKKKCKGEKK